MQPHFGKHPAANKVSRFLVALVAAIALTFGSLDTVVLAPPAWGAALTCRASMSNPVPKQRSFTDVLVSTAARADVTTTARYKTTNTKKTTKAGLLGKATLRYNISTATVGFTVVVDVVVMSGGKSARCSTKFVPQAR
jgi:hypothetical protein